VSDDDKRRTRRIVIELVLIVALAVALIFAGGRTG
jgi:hypothetical protein